MSSTPDSAGGAGIRTGPGPHEAASALVRSRPARIFAAREGRWLVVAGDDRHVLPAAAVQLLRCSTTPRTLAGHEAAFAAAEGIGRDRIPAVRAMLAELIRKGLLEDAAAAGAPVAITTIVIPVGEDSATVSRCRESFAENAREFGHEVRFVVSEDGDANPRRELWVKRLCAAVPEAVARFLLYGDPRVNADTHGASRNLLLLETAGEAVLSVDGDMVCEWRRSPEYQPGLAVSARQPARRWFHAAPEAGGAPAPPEPFDVLGHFGAGLGEPAFAGESVISEERLPSRVAIVQAGLSGDTGRYSPLERLLWSTREGERLWEDWWRTCGVTAVARCETLVTGPHGMTGCAAIDGRVPLAPFPPMDRFDGEAFATLLWMTRGDWAIRHLPWSVWREPMPARAFEPDAHVEQAGEFRIGEMVLEFLYHAKPPTLAAAADWLSEAASWDAHTFQPFVSRLRRQGIEKQIAAIRGAIEEHGGKPEWRAKELRRVIEALESAVDGARLLAGSEHVQEYLGAFGEVLRHWPAMWECARSHAGERE